MPASFNEFSESLLLERKFDAEMGQAAEKSFNIFSEKLMDALEKLGNHFIRVIQREDGDLTWAEKSFRNDFYIYGGRGDLIPGGFYNASNWDDRMLRATINGFLLNTINEKLSDFFSIEGSKIIDNNRSVFVVRNSPDLIVLPKSIKPKQLSDIFGSNKPAINIILHTGGNVQISSKEDNALGTYHTPLINYGKDSGRAIRFHLDEAKINIAGFTSLDVENILPMVKFMISNRDKKNLLRSSVRDWLTIAEGNLRRAKSTYIHEYTHFFDDIRMKGVTPKNVEIGTREAWKASGRDMGLYYKSDIEWNAHFQDTATVARSAMRDFMVAIQNKAVAFSILQAHMTKEGDDYVFDEPYKPAWNGLVAQKIEIILRWRLSAISDERIKMYVGLTQQADYPVSHKQEAQRMLNIFVLQGKTLLGQLFLFIFNLFLQRKGDFVSFLLKDDKFRKKFFSRMYSVAEDLKAIYDAAMNNVKSGKFPTKQAWNNAVKGFVALPGTNLKGLRMSSEWSRMKVTDAAHLDLYNGSFMRSYIGKNGPFEPNKPIPGDLAGFVGL
jgi:hypothetical protein